MLLVILGERVVHGQAYDSVSHVGDVFASSTVYVFDDDGAFENSKYLSMPQVRYYALLKQEPSLKKLA